MAPKKQPGCPLYVVVDARERSVIPFLAEQLDTPNRRFGHVVQQITTGDYTICAGAGTVLASLERKTLADFAASFRDGRYENIEKMRALRARTGCQLYYIIEGPAFPALSLRINRIPYANILAAITKLMVRDGVHIIQTADEAHTAKRIADLVRAFDEHYADPRRGVCADLFKPASAARGGADAGPDEESTGPDERAAGQDEKGAGPDEKGAGQDGKGGAVPEILTERTEKTDGLVVAQMWAQLRGVSIVLGRLLAARFSVAGLARRQVTPEQVRALRTATGRQIGKDAVASLLALQNGDTKLAAKLVAGMTGVSAPTAEVLVSGCGSLAILCESPPDDLAQMKIPRRGAPAAESPEKGRSAARLGPARAERVHKWLNYCEAPAAAPAAKPTTAQSTSPRTATPTPRPRTAGPAVAKPTAAAKPTTAAAKPTTAAAKPTTAAAKPTMAATKPTKAAEPTVATKPTAAAKTTAKTTTAAAAAAEPADPTAQAEEDELQVLLGEC